MKQKLRLFLIMLLFIASPLYADADPEFTFTDLEGGPYTSTGLCGLSYNGIGFELG